MLHIDIICIGKLKEEYLKNAIAEYSKRLSKYCNLNIIELPDEKIPNTNRFNSENNTHLRNFQKKLKKYP